MLVSTTLSRFCTLVCAISTAALVVSCAPRPVKPALPDTVPPGPPVVSDSLGSRLSVRQLDGPWIFESADKQGRVWSRAVFTVRNSAVVVEGMTPPWHFTPRGDSFIFQYTQFEQYMATILHPCEDGSYRGKNNAGGWTLLRRYRPEGLIPVARNALDGSWEGRYLAQSPAPDAQFAVRHGETDYMDWSHGGNSLRLSKGRRDIILHALSSDSWAGIGVDRGSDRGHDHYFMFDLRRTGSIPVYGSPTVAQ